MIILISLALFTQENAKLTLFSNIVQIVSFSFFFELASSHHLVIGTNCDIQGCPSARPLFCSLKSYIVLNTVQFQVVLTNLWCYIVNLLPVCLVLMVPVCGVWLRWNSSPFTCKCDLGNRIDCFIS
ncbi:hypothetical protein CR513_51116, partial [Mucuna pruriens]